MSTKANPDLQVRAGRNMPNVLGIMSGNATKAYKLTQQETVVLESDNGFLIPGAVVFFFGSSFIEVHNETGVAIDVTLYLEAPDGSRVAVTAANVLSGNTFDNMYSDVFLPEGFKYILAVAQPVNAMGGVHVIVGASQTANNGAVTSNTSKITSTQIDAPKTPGVCVAGDSHVFLNCGPSPVDVQMFTVFEEDGLEVFTGSNTASPGGYVTLSSGVVVGEGSFTRFKFIDTVTLVPVTPANMYYQQDQFFRANAFPFDPAI